LVSVPATLSLCAKNPPGLGQGYCWRIQPLISTMSYIHGSAGYVAGPTQYQYGAAPQSTMAGSMSNTWGQQSSYSMPSATATASAYAAPTAEPYTTGSSTMVTPGGSYPGGAAAPSSYAGAYSAQSPYATANPYAASAQAPTYGSTVTSVQASPAYSNQAAMGGASSIASMQTMQYAAGAPTTTGMSQAAPYGGLPPPPAMNGPFKFYANPADCPAAGCMGAHTESSWPNTEPAAAHGGYAADAGAYGQHGAHGQYGSSGQNGAYDQHGAYGADGGYHATDAGGFGGAGPSTHEHDHGSAPAHGMPNAAEHDETYGKGKKQTKSNQKLKVSQRKRVGCC